MAKNPALFADFGLSLKIREKADAHAQRNATKK
jgi:hypothetical protein